MIKRVNSTGRRRISREHVVIEVHDGRPRRFDAVIDLAEFDAPPDAAVVLEATCAGSNTIRRFEWGTVSRLSPPVDRELRELTGENVFFSLKVIDRTEQFGRILGLAENIRPIKAGPRTATGRRGILPVEQADLGDELWRLDFRPEDVFLLVNKRISGLADRVRCDPGLYPLIYPAIVRQVLASAFEEVADEEEDTERWPALWLQFGRRLHPEQANPRMLETDEDQEQWIEDVVAEFCREHRLKDRFLQSTGGTAKLEEFLCSFVGSTEMACQRSATI